MNYLVLRVNTEYNSADMYANTVVVDLDIETCKELVVLEDIAQQLLCSNQSLERLVFNGDFLRVRYYAEYPSELGVRYGFSSKAPFISVDKIKSTEIKIEVSKFGMYILGCVDVGVYFAKCWSVDRITFETLSQALESLSE